VAYVISAIEIPTFPKGQTNMTNHAFDRVALLLQGGGALGSYQTGVYEALAEAGLEPDWVAGISIGAINSALIAGNAPENRVARLREFWEAVSMPPLRSLGIVYNPSFMDIQNEEVRRMVNRTRALGIAMFGAPGFFTPRNPFSLMLPAETPDELSMYDVAPLRKTLERLVDFDRINAAEMRFSVGRSRGGITTKILALTDSLGNLVDFRLMPGQAHDLRAVPDLIEGLCADHLLADRAFDADWLRSALDEQDITPVIPPKSNRRFPAKFNKETYKWRHLIENYFGKLKENRGIAMRSCKTDQSFAAFISLAATAIQLR